MAKDLMHLDEHFIVNNALNEFFFSGRFEHRPVYIDLEGDAEERVAEVLGVEPTALSDHVGRVVSETLRLEETNPYIQQIEWLRKWNDAGRVNAPPFTALLCAFSIAAERMGTDQNFSNNNYYVRLFELLGIEGPTTKHRLKQCAKHTRQFWRALNIWLSENDFEFGRPTARAVNNWPYASYGLSQALVRDADRARFERMFEAMHFVPGESVGRSEMMLFVNEWMSSASGPTVWLRKLWDVADLRERVVAAAIEELETWNPQGEIRASGPGRTRLFWSLGFAGFPKRRAVLSLGARSKKGAEPLIVEDVSDDVVAEALSSVREEVWLRETASEGILSLSPAANIDICRLLLGSVNFRGETTETCYTFTSKPVVVLARTEDGSGFREVQRATIFEETAVLCHGTWLSRVNAHLEICARPGFQVLSPSDIPGIPDGWNVVRDVELVRALDNPKNGLQSLNPITGQAAISTVGGVKLNPGLWHTDAPPRLEATSLRSGAKLEVSRESIGQSDKKLLTVEASGDFMETDLDEVEIFAGLNLRATVKKGATELAEQGISFRSAEFPRPLGRHVLYRPIDDGVFSWHSAKVSNGAPEGGYMKGAAVNALRYQDGPVGTADFLTTTEIPSGELEDEIFHDWKQGVGAEQEAPGTCVVKGYHHLKFDAFEDGDDRYDAKRGKCLVCGWETMSRSRDEAYKNARAMRAEAVVNARKPRRSNLELVEHAEVQEFEANQTVNAVLDGLSYLGRGSWAHFKRLAGSVSDDPWFASNLADDLEALGHLELVRDNAGLPREWQVTPPVVVKTGGASAYLAGFQSNELIEKIDKALSLSGALYRPVSTETGFVLHKWSVKNSEDIDALVAQIKDPHGRPVTAVANLAALIAQNTQSLPASVAAMTTVDVDAADVVARFDIATARWVSVNDAKRPGAYKVDLHGTRYVLVDRNGVQKMTSHAAAKILAAGQEAGRLNAYDPVTKTFSSVLGAEPPGLFARALVASSGNLPRQEGGRVFIDGVQPLVGGMIISKLYEGTW